MVEEVEHFMNAFVLELKVLFILVWGEEPAFKAVSVKVRLVFGEVSDFRAVWMRVKLIFTVGQVQFVQLLLINQF